MSYFYYTYAFLMAQMVKNLPAMLDTRVWSLDWEDPLVKGMATHSSILAWRIPWAEEPGGLQSMGSQSDMTERLIHTQLYLRSTCVCWSLSHVQLCAIPWTVARQAPLPMGFCRQEYWSGLPCPPPGDLPDPGIEPGSPTLQADSAIWATRKASKGP